MTLVIDSSVAAKWFLEESGSAEAEALQLRDDVIASDLLIPEVLNTIWKKREA
ncbi:MAG TPA: type II toxin-antitoxin system VapC family toxin [Rhizomicrobium sp.]|jgi:predicted nucleic acid-binding protein|nr:type II toxin-antitoxin system VapC family toxin [Rhizomicrobium sp.]